MSDIITVTGIVATAPRHLVTSTGLAITSFRLASGQRKFDRGKQAWVDAETNWYTISTFRQLAHNVVASVRRGEHLVVAGRLRIRDWHNADKNGTAIEIEADSVGHDLTWCTTISRRVVPAPARLPEEAPESSAEDGLDHDNDSDRSTVRDPEESDGFVPRDDVGPGALDPVTSGRSA